MRAAIRERAGRGGIYFRLVVFLAALFAAAALLWMLGLPWWVMSEIRARTGFEAQVASLSCNPFAGRLTMRGLVLTNPTAFPAHDFLQLREFHAVGDLPSLLSDRIALDELVLDVRRLDLVRRADGTSNLELFEQRLGFASRMPASTAVAPEKSAAGPAPPPPSAPPGRKFVIRQLTLRFDELVLADYSGAKPGISDYKFALDQHYENVTEGKQLLVPDVLRRVAAENLGPVLARLVPGDFGRALGDTARAAAKTGEAALQDAGAQATDLLRGLREKLEEKKKP